MYRLITDDSRKSERPQNPRVNANIFEIVTFSWILNLFKLGRIRDLSDKDLYATLNDHKSSTLGDELEKKWNIELDNAKKVSRNPSLFHVLVRMFGGKFILYGLLQAFIEIVVKIPQPLLIGELLTYFNSDNSEKKNPVHVHMCALGLVLSLFASMSMFQGAQIEMLQIGMKIRVSCSSVIYKKALRLSKMTFEKSTVGQMVNILSNDVLRLDSVLLTPHYLWISPVQTIIATYFIWQQIGVSSIFGMVTCFLFIPLQGWLCKKTSEFRLKTAVATDERVRLINEIISGIQVIKMYTWEKTFAYLVQLARKEEIRLIKGSSYVKATLTSFVSFHTRMSFFVCILSYVLLGNRLSAQQVFVITAYYQILQSTLTTRFNHGIEQLAEIKVTIKRIQNYLLYEEKDNRVEKVTANDNDIALNNITNYHDDTKHLRNSGIVISDVSTKWTDNNTDNGLQNVSLTVPPGGLVAIVGRVGSGKSSLIQAILRELPLSEGNISAHGTVSYASQEPWLFSGSVKQNILFDSPMNSERYDQVVKVCALEVDFKQLPYGDRTIVGEKGVMLSGGQKARISLARAVYKQTDIYLLDDPLSAVDAGVGKQLFEKCIKGYLTNKTRILVTHQLQYLPDVDHIIFMDNMSVLAEGTYGELWSKNLDFVEFYRSSIDKKDSANNDPNNQHKNVQDLEKKNLLKTVYIDENKDSGVLAMPMETTESKSSGKISRTVYMSYISAIGGTLKIILFILICISVQMFASGGDLWITYWVNLERHVFHDVSTPSAGNGTMTADSRRLSATLMWWTISERTCLVVFAFFICATIMATAVRSIAFVSVCTRASIRLHETMYNAVTGATVYFFNTNSSGSILNRLSKDMGAIDERILVPFMDFIHHGSTLMGVIIIVGIIDVYLLVPTFVLAFLFYKLTKYYLSTSRSVKRLEGITRSPMIAHLNESLQGLTTIRAFNAERILCREFDNHQDLHSSAWYLFITSNRAFGLWLDLVCLIYITIVIFSFIIVDDGKLRGNIGLAVTQAFGLAGALQMGMRQSAELENHMTSVERVLEYTKIPQEAALESTSNKKPPPQWPVDGRIVFTNYYFQYSPNGPFVLRNINIEIEPMEKVGIVGRTGAGKSSLMGALFRLAIDRRGTITVDGVEIHELDLHELRSRLSVIPQEPVLFSGTVRRNLDPFDEHTDGALWDALDEVKLKTVVQNSPDGLNTKISEGGSNFSVGQRQLFCLARAIVRNNKILVLDEATANVDQQTDGLIQNTIRNKFRSCTVLTIAHRLHTVMDSDKVLVLDGGVVVEFDHPHILLGNNNGYLYTMAEQTGRASLDSLRNKAEESFKAMQMNKQSPMKMIDDDAENNQRKK